MKLDNPPARVLNETQAAKYLALSRSTLAHSRMNGPRRGHVPPPPYVKVGRSVRYLRDDLDRWLERHRHVFERTR